MIPRNVVNINKGDKKKAVSKKTEPTTFGKELKKLRAKHKQTQLEVAVVLGVTPAFISTIELGKRPMPARLMEKLVVHFTLTKSQEEMLRQLTAQEQLKSKIDISGFTEKQRELVLAVIAALPTLTAINIKKIYKYLNPVVN